MRVNSIVPTSQIVSNDKQKTRSKNLSFKTYNPAVANKIEERLATRGIICNTNGNDFVAKCYENTVNLFETLFGKSYLPTKLSFRPMSENLYGIFDSFPNEVAMNEQFNSKCYYDINNLASEAKKNYNWILPGWNSTKHPAHIFVHEFSHAAHWNHLQDKHGRYEAMHIMGGLHDTSVPTGIGKLITKFKISGYATKGNMKEFLAERMTKDICNGITDTLWLPYKDIDVDYSNIFNKKWDYRYSSPQSYIDYFTQQVWDGDIDEANRVGALATLYLAELEAKEVAPVVQKVANFIDYTPQDKTEETKPLIFKIGTWLSNKITTFNENITRNLDEKNKLKLNI